MKFRQLQYDAGASSSGGGASQHGPSFEDLTNPDYVPPAGTTPPIVEEGKGGTPVEGLNEDGTAAEGYELKDGVPVKKDTQEPPAPVEGVNADGTLQDGYEKTADGTVQKIAAAGDEPGEDDEPDFWKAVEAITGREVPVEYGEADPTSPEGVALRDKALIDLAEKGMDEYYRKTNPRAYAYYLHTLEGGTDEEFFGTLPPALPARAEFEQDIDIQSAILKQDLVARGVPEDIAQATIDKYIKDNLLTEKALKLYDTYHATEQAEIKRMEKAAEDQKKAFNAQVAELNTSITDAITKEMGFTVPVTKQPEFEKFVKDQIRYDDGKFFLVQGIEKTSLSKTLEALYFQFVKGDLKSMISKAAKTQTVQNLRIKADADKKKNSGGEGAPTTPKYVTFGEI